MAPKGPQKGAFSRPKGPPKAPPKARKQDRAQKPQEQKARDSGDHVLSTFFFNPRPFALSSVSRGKDLAPETALTA